MKNNHNNYDSLSNINFNRKQTLILGYASDFLAYTFNRFLFGAIIIYGNNTGKIEI